MAYAALFSMLQALWRKTSRTLVRGTGLGFVFLCFWFGVKSVGKGPGLISHFGVAKAFKGYEPKSWSKKTSTVKTNL